MKVITFNANGIRAAARKGFFAWLEQEQADFVCIQETKAKFYQLTEEIFSPQGYYCYYYDAVKNGYSGVAIYSKLKPNKVNYGFGFKHITEQEGRYIQADFGALSLVSIYVPSGTMGDERQTIKYELMQLYLDLLQQQINSGRQYIICGDFNIVHKEIDIKNWSSNQKNSGCLKEERAWLDQLFVEIGLLDAFREVNKDPHQYTWWSHYANARANNVGWRIDYQLISSGLKGSVINAAIYTKENFSDHAPLCITYNTRVLDKLINQ